MNQQSPYATLIIAGFGSIGQAILKLRVNITDKFEKIVIVDRRALRREEIPGENRYEVVSGDIKDHSFLDGLISKAPKPVLFLNLSTDVDTFGLRLFLSKYPVAYIDSGAGVVPGDSAPSIQKMMEYVTKPVKSPYPHLICQGINPGMVELIARILMSKMAGEGGLYNIEVIEIDSFTAPTIDDKIPLAWSPEVFLDEMSLLPTFEKKNGLCFEYPLPTKEVKVYWKGKEMRGRVVAHEDIWSLSRIEGVVGARFIYSLNDPIMEAISLPYEEVLRRLYVPDNKTPVFGVDTVIVHVKEVEKSISRALCWSVDHLKTWERYGVNGVQYQTGMSLLFSVELLLKGVIEGRYHPYTLSNIPFNHGNYGYLERMIKEAGILWKELEIGSIPEVVEGS
ncbi:MAG: hypothetical protein N2745_05850 [Syntrophorhabdaceae bacterium]|nr:hypothetical protein [Syntrophorhabdaceae bacterium]